jgi:hypothetical protein
MKHQLDEQSILIGTSPAPSERTFHYSGLPFNHSDFFAETPGPRGPLRKVINHDNKANCISLRTHKNTQAEPIGTIGIRTAPRSSYDRLTAFIALPEGPLAVHHPDTSLVLEAPSEKTSNYLLPKRESPPVARLSVINRRFVRE